MSVYRFLEPLDVLFLRGNKLFGDPGSFGESQMPPWPSVAAGAIRSQMLVNDDFDLSLFAKGNSLHPQLGTPADPGEFTVCDITLARRFKDGTSIETFRPLPADLIATEDSKGEFKIYRLKPTSLNDSINTSSPFLKVAAFATDRPAKPIPGMWLNQTGWQSYLDGVLPQASDLIRSDELWKIDLRVGVGLDTKHGSAEPHKLFSVQAVSLNDGHGFLVAIDGAEPPSGGILRLGGDGRGASVSAANYQSPEPDYDAIAASGHCRIILKTPGLFPAGWYPSGTDDNMMFSFGGVSGRLICAAVSRSETISGWDLAEWEPKPAQRVVPIGSVYWLEELQATADAMRKLAETGLWPKAEYDESRRAEGFNRLTFAAY